MYKFIRKINQERFVAPKLTPTHSSVILYTPSIVQPLFHETDDSDPSEPVQKMHNDVFLLFNQERLNNLGVDSLRTYLDSLVSKDDKLAQLRQHVSDEQLLMFIKSRRLTEPSEIRVWLEYLSNEYGKQNETLLNVVNSLETKSEPTDPPSE